MSFGWTTFRAADRITFRAAPPGAREGGSLRKPKLTGAREGGSYEKPKFTGAREGGSYEKPKFTGARETFAWVNRFRRLRVRYDERADIHEAFLLLGCALICWAPPATGLGGIAATSPSGTTMSASRSLEHPCLWRPQLSRSVG
jgi:hypothetical protein